MVLWYLHAIFHEIFQAKNFRESSQHYLYGVNVLPMHVFCVFGIFCVKQATLNSRKSVSLSESVILSEKKAENKNKTMLNSLYKKICYIDIK